MVFQVFDYFQVYHSMFPRYFIYFLMFSRYFKKRMGFLVGG